MVPDELGIVKVALKWQSFMLIKIVHLLELQINLKYSVCRNERCVLWVGKIATLLQGWLCVWVLCALQMCCNVRMVVRDFALNVLSLEGERIFVLGYIQRHTSVIEYFLL